jgi:hypothetical protein
MAAACVAGAVLLAGVNAGAEGVAVSRADRQVNQQLENTLVSFTFNEQPLAEALDFLATLGNVNIVLDKRQAGDAKTLTLKLSNVPLQTAIELAVEQVGLKWIVKDGIVFVSDEEGVKQEPVTVVYHVLDLLAQEPTFGAPEFDLNAINQQAQTRGGATSTNPFPLAEPEKDKKTTKTQEELLQELVDMIREVIAPGTWDDAGVTK